MIQGGILPDNLGFLLNHWSQVKYLLEIAFNIQSDEIYGGERKQDRVPGRK